MAGMIVFVHLFNDRSGSPKVLSQVATALSGKGVRTEMLTSSSGGGPLKGIADKDRTVFYKRTENRYITLFFDILSQLHLFVTCLRYLRVDAVFYINTMRPTGAMLAAKLMRKDVVCHIHETSIKPLLFKRFLRAVVSLCASKVIFVSDYLRRVEGFLIADQRVIHNATPVVPELTSGEKKNVFTVLMACSLKRYKGVFEFLEVASTLSEDQFIKFTLVLNADVGEIRTFFQGVAVPANVCLVPRLSDVSSLYADAGLVMNLSRPTEWVETFGLTLIEAFSFGVPVIGPEVGGPAEVVRNGLDGYLIDSSRISAIAEKIQEIAHDRSEWERLSANAAKRADDFSLSVFEQRVATLMFAELSVL
ncbi:glycosyltransferase family 4 protein [Luminiphilus sp.]|nr:glycosyltransferase family 4 protein [Luminiphilus sp.]MDA8986075.1 glycosyltransferase family 4 protein [Luminiphilus sp.]MDB2642986.1 glycosyltransferase family 4 protein [Luminiphilus sp.]MDB4049007.1 glycosyltransferase family 4 protein [Luminiphilus sp.]MDC1117248.1 glycosyltransferase family 4 protein [Luminiphilus sp.]